MTQCAHTNHPGHDAARGEESLVRTVGIRRRRPLQNPAAFSISALPQDSQADSRRRRSTRLSSHCFIVSSCDGFLMICRCAPCAGCRDGCFRTAAYSRRCLTRRVFAAAEALPASTRRRHFAWRDARLIVVIVGRRLPHRHGVTEGVSDARENISESGIKIRCHDQIAPNNAYGSSQRFRDRWDRGLVALQQLVINTSATKSFQCLSNIDRAVAICHSSRR